MIGTRTRSVTPATLQQKWYVIDAKDVVLGRLASTVALVLRGKHKPNFTPHMNMGDYMIIINAAQVYVTGRKKDGLDGKLYHHHTMYPGGIKTESYRDLQQRAPERVIELAVKGMLPKGPLGRAMYRRMHVYADHLHPHAAQTPAVWPMVSGTVNSSATGTEDQSE
jgi:large subunit ribosomal protein L13